MQRRTKYGFPVKPVRPPESRTTIFEPTLGFDGGQAPQELFPGFTPDSQNFEHEGGYIRPRSGISRYDATYQVGGPVVWGMEGFDIEGRRNAIAVSSDTASFMGANALNWSSLSWVAASGASDQTLAGDIENGVDGASVYEPVRDRNIFVWTNNRQLPKFAEVRDSTTTFSDFTWASSHFSRAKSLAEFDNRLVWFNLSTSSLSYPQRVLWSPRGQPLNYTIADGAGFEDLMDMRGTGQRIIPDGDSLVAFSDEQIWRGRRRGDFYAFDWYAINRELGCPYPRTICETPYGIAFLGRDLEWYMLMGDQTIPLGPTKRKPPELGDHSRVQLFLQRKLANGDLAWAHYSAQQNRISLHFTSNEADTNLWPTNRLDYNFDNTSFFLSRFSHELTFGFEMQDVEEALTWDSIPYNWNDYNVPWDTAGLGVPAKRSVVFSSSGTPYRYRSDQTSDDGTAIDARWRSHGLGQADAFRQDELFEVWVEYASDTSSSLSVMVSGDLGRTFNEGFARELSASSNAAAMYPVLITSTSPMFEVRVNDGSVPKISRIQANMRDGGRFGST